MYVQENLSGRKTITARKGTKFNGKQSQVRKRYISIPYNHLSLTESQCIMSPQERMRKAGYWEATKSQSGPRE